MSPRIRVAILFSVGLIQLKIAHAVNAHESTEAEHGASLACFADDPKINDFSAHSYCAVRHLQSVGKTASAPVSRVGPRAAGISPVEDVGESKWHVKNLRLSEEYLAFLAGSEVGAASATRSFGEKIGQAKGAPRFLLEDLVSQAIESHPSVAAKVAEREGAEADLQSARWQYFPTPSVGMRRTDSNKTTAIYSLQQPLWAWGRIDAGLDAARARSISAEVSILEARHNLALSVASAYQAWMQSVGRSDAYSRALEFHEAQVLSIQRRVQGGVSAEVDLELVMSRVAQMKADLAAAQSATRVALAKLSQYVGKSLASNDLKRSGPDDSLFQGGLPEKFENIVQAAGRHYPLLRRLDADLEAAGHDVRVKKASYLPSVSLRADREQNDSYVTSLGGRFDNRLMITVDFAPGAGLSSASATASAEAKLESLRGAREAAYRDLVERISAEYEDFRSAQRRREDLVRTQRSALKVLASYSRQFEAGKRGWLDVMNAAREMAQIDASLADADAQVVAAGYRLKLYVGLPDWYGQNQPEK